MLFHPKINFLNIEIEKFLLRPLIFIICLAIFVFGIINFLLGTFLSTKYCNYSANDVLQIDQKKGDIWFIIHGVTLCFYSFIMLQIIKRCKKSAEIDHYNNRCTGIGCFKLLEIFLFLIVLALQIYGSFYYL